MAQTIESPTIHGCPPKTHETAAVRESSRLVSSRNPIAMARWMRRQATVVRAGVRRPLQPSCDEGRFGTPVVTLLASLVQDPERGVFLFHGNSRKHANQAKHAREMWMFMVSNTLIARITRTNTSAQSSQVVLLQGLVKKSLGIP